MITARPLGRDIFAPLWWVLAIVVNAIVLLEFRHFATLDGPMHALHAAIMKHRVLGPYPPNAEVWYEARSMRWMAMDLLAWPLVDRVDPFTLHLCCAIIVVLLTGLGALALARAYGAEINPFFVLILPQCFGYPLVLGFFPFLLGTSAALFATAWWVRRDGLRWPQLGWMAGCVAIAAWIHPTAPALIALLAGCHEGWMRVTAGERSRQRWAGIPRRARWVAAIAVVLLSAAIAVRALPNVQGVVGSFSEAGAAFTDAAQLRALLLFAIEQERGSLLIATALLALSIAGCILTRWRSLRRPVPMDGLLMAVVSLMLCSLLLSGPAARLRYVPERAQWLALLVLTAWIALQPVKAKWMLPIALVVLIGHGLRLGYIERTMAPLARPQRAALEAVAYFRPGSEVLPLVCEDNWLLTHTTAFVALAHDGVLITANEHLPYRWKERWTRRMRQYVAGVNVDPSFLAGHVIRGDAPHIEHLVVFGNDRGSCDSARAALMMTLGHYYATVFSNGYATVYTRR